MATKKVTSATKETETAKVESVKAETVKSAAVKAEPAKTPVTEAAEEKKVSEKKAPAKKTTTTKAAAKKPAAKKTTAKKQMKVNAFIQYYGKQVEEQDIVARVKKAWTASGNKVGDIKTMDLYIKPEEATVYYVINGTEKGTVAF